MSQPRAHAETAVSRPRGHSCDTGGCFVFAYTRRHVRSRHTPPRLYRRRPSRTLRRAALCAGRLSGRRDREPHARVGRRARRAHRRLPGGRHPATGCRRRRPGLPDGARRPSRADGRGAALRRVTSWPAGRRSLQRRVGGRPARSGEAARRSHRRLPSSLSVWRHRRRPRPHRRLLGHDRSRRRVACDAAATCCRTRLPSAVDSRGRPDALSRGRALRGELRAVRAGGSRRAVARPRFRRGRRAARTAADAGRHDRDRARQGARERAVRPGVARRHGHRRTPVGTA